MDVLNLAGAYINFKEGRVLANNRNKLTAFEFDAKLIARSFSAVGFAGACCNGTSVIKGTAG
jgi:5-enolpyruvylshikimate-3-phosphate synthase